MNGIAHPSTHPAGLIRLLRSWSHLPAAWGHQRRTGPCACVDLALINNQRSLASSAKHPHHPSSRALSILSYPPPPLSLLLPSSLARDGRMDLSVGGWGYVICVCVLFVLCYVRVRVRVFVRDVCALWAQLRAGGGVGGGGHGGRSHSVGSAGGRNEARNTSSSARGGSGWISRAETECSQTRGCAPCLHRHGRMGSGVRATRL